jgi:hypothetical protein
MDNYKFNITVSETPFWVIQRSTRSASQTDLIVVLLLTAVTLYSALRVAVKITMKLREKGMKWCCKKCLRRRKLSNESIQKAAFEATGDEAPLLYPSSLVE